MKSYRIASVFWNDHCYADRQPIPETPDELIDVPTISVGIIMRETDKSILLTSTLEPVRGEATYLVILKSAIVNIKNYGKIRLAV